MTHTQTTNVAKMIRKGAGNHFGLHHKSPALGCLAFTHHPSANSSVELHKCSGHTKNGIHMHLCQSTHNHCIHGLTLKGQEEGRVRAGVQNVLINSTVTMLWPVRVMWGNLTAFMSKAIIFCIVDTENIAECYMHLLWYTFICKQGYFHC